SPTRTPTSSTQNDSSHHRAKTTYRPPRTNDSRLPSVYPMNPRRPRSLPMRLHRAALLLALIAAPSAARAQDVIFQRCLTRWDDCRWRDDDYWDRMDRARERAQESRDRAIERSANARERAAEARDRALERSLDAADRTRRL